MLKLFISLMAFAFLLPQSVLAQDQLSHPAYFSVFGVAANDVLNMRKAARASSEKVGALAHNAAPVEVLFVENGWGYVSSGESSGFVSMAFLKPAQLPTLGETHLPRSLSCGGTEPFWDMNFAQNKLNISQMGSAFVSPQIVDAGNFHNLGGSTAYVLAQSGDVSATAIVRNRICSDGMSDRAYGREIDLLIRHSGQTTAYSGCCTVYPAN